jgi:hypothetical protein
MYETRRKLLFEQLEDLHASTREQLTEAFMGKEVTLIGTWPKVSRGRAALIDGIIFDHVTGEPLFLCMVLRSGAKEGERDFLNSATWTRSYRPWKEFLVMDRCVQCGASPVRDNLDGDDLCQGCCDKWARGEAPDPDEERE